MKPPLKQGAPDDFQTPPYALKPLLPYIPKEWIVWEPACGHGYLVDALEGLGYRVLATELHAEPSVDFLTDLAMGWDVVITNPPYSIKQQFLERCYELGKPFALLLPLTTFETGKRQKLFRDNGLEVIFMDKRINFETPNKVKKSSAWFATAWFTWGLNIGQAMSFVELDRS